MRYASALFALALTVAAPAAAQTADPQLELLDRMTGHWVLRGVIAKKQTTHDIDVAWVLNKEYVQIHEVSREKDAQGRPAYDAIIYIAWNPKLGEYSCLWLDNTATWDFKATGIGHAKPAADRIALRFQDPDGGIDRTTFAYDRKAGSWSWTIDSESKGKTTRFADVKLTRE